MLTYATVSSGIECLTVAWHPLGFSPVWFSEIAPFPSAVLQYHYPHVPNLGDMNTAHEKAAYAATPIDLLAGGTPCQAFSVAGLRKGMDDPRGNLTLVYARMVMQLQPRWIVWENVPGVLSSNKGRDFGAFIGALRQLGYSLAWRVLDAQYFGVPQRRRRVFLIGHSSGDWRYPAAVLSDAAGLPGYYPEGDETEPSTTSRTGGRIAATVSAKWRTGRGGPSGDECQNLVTGTLCAGGKSAGSVTQQDVESGMLVFQSKASSTQSMNPGVIAPTLDVSKRGGHTLFNAAACAHEMVFNSNIAPTLTSGSHNNGGHRIGLHHKNQVRRLTPIECERLQGLQDDYTKIPYRGRSIDECPDGPRYQVIGNGMAVPVIDWLGRRIDFVDTITKSSP